QRKMCIDQSNRSTKKDSHHQNAMMRTLFHYFWLVMSQPLLYVKKQENTCYDKEMKYLKNLNLSFYSTNKEINLK
ncbi:hypothetical protein MHL30_21220, partial [Priestia flexa]|uniref:hypothetical protein n=1 Tax=Priestia flexa TaxID=86664 RepID=UPI001EF7022C